MKAIQDIGGNLIAIHDISDSVGIIDSYFPKTQFFQEFKEFQNFIQHRKNTGQPLNYLTVCSPNFLHKEHIQFGLEMGADIICEKPIVIDEKDIDDLQKLEKINHQRVYTILQLRYHPSILALKEKVNHSNISYSQIELEYITSRGPWYQNSWKGDIQKSGGIAINIGIHLFDMLSWIFGTMIDCQVEDYNSQTARGVMKMERAHVLWKISTDENQLPLAAKKNNQRTYRSIRIDGMEIEFSDGFTDLHTTCYREIIEGRGLGLEDARESIRISNKIRTYDHQ